MQVEFLKFLQISAETLSMDAEDAAGIAAPGPGGVSSFASANLGMGTEYDFDVSLVEVLLRSCFYYSLSCRRLRQREEMCSLYFVVKLHCSKLVL